MASLIENLIRVLQEECTAYEELLELSMKKTPVIVGGDLDGLQRITEEEQIIVARINQLDTRREEVTGDIANVLNKDVTKLKLSHIVDLLSQRPEEQRPLAETHDRLRSVMGQMKRVNEQNQELIRNSLEMVEFDLNLLHSMKSAPQTADYNRGAYNSGSILGGTSGFDARQ